MSETASDPPVPTEDLVERVRREYANLDMDKRHNDGPAITATKQRIASLEAQLAERRRERKQRMGVLPHPDWVAQRLADRASA